MVVPTSRRGRQDKTNLLCRALDFVSAVVPRESSKPAEEVVSGLGVNESATGRLVSEPRERSGPRIRLACGPRGQDMPRERVSACHEISGKQCGDGVLMQLYLLGGRVGVVRRDEIDRWQGSCEPWRMCSDALAKCHGIMIKSGPATVCSPRRSGAVSPPFARSRACEPVAITVTFVSAPSRCNDRIATPQSFTPVTSSRKRYNRRSASSLVRAQVR